MRSPKKFFIRMFAGISAALALAAVFFLVAPPQGERGVVSAQAVQQIFPIDGWAWGLTTDTSTLVQLGTNARINPRGTLEFLNVPGKEVNPAGPGFVALINTTGTPRFVEPGVTTSTLPRNGYGLRFVKTSESEMTGYLEGYIWSSSLGWIEFEESYDGVFSDDCPSGFTDPCGAEVDSGLVKGWARIVSIPEALALGYDEDDRPCGNAGDDNDTRSGHGADCRSGWIHLGWTHPNVAANSPNHLALRRIASPAPRDVLSGWAYSNEYGWLRFDGVLGNATTGNPRCSISASRSPTPGPSTVTWTCSDVRFNSCELFETPTGGARDSLESGLGANGSRDVNISADTDYEISCDGMTDDTATDSVTVLYAPRVASCILTADLLSVRLPRNGSAANSTLRWRCENVDESSCALTDSVTSVPSSVQAVVGQNGEDGFPVTLSRTTTYEISCDHASDPNVQVSDTARVTVISSNGFIECTPGSPSPDCPR